MSFSVRAKCYTFHSKADLLHVNLSMNFQLCTNYCMKIIHVYVCFCVCCMHACMPHVCKHMSLHACASCVNSQLFVYTNCTAAKLTEHYSKGSAPEFFR